MTIMKTSRTYRLVLVAMAAVWLSATVARANLGTVTAGTVNGVTINGSTITGGTLTAGGGSEVFIDNHGITLEAGNAVANQVKWDDGSFIYSSSGGMLIHTVSGLIVGVGTSSPFIVNDDQILPQVPLKFDDGVTSPIVAEASSWHNGNQFVCVSSSGTFFPSTFACN
jgi:hypothetical protein